MLILKSFYKPARMDLKIQRIKSEKLFFSYIIKFSIYQACNF